MPSDKFVTANGLRLHYLDHGGEGRPWLVCIHGLTGNAHNFDALAPHLTPKFHVLAIDVRGRGDSEWGDGADYLPQNYAADLAGLFGAIGVERTSLIGTSMGGVISIMYAGGWPDRVERAVLNDIGPEIDPAGIARIQGYLAETPERFADIGEVAAYFRKNYPPMAKLPEAVLRGAVKWSVKPGPEGGLVWKSDPAIRRPVRGRAGQQRLDLWVPYARIICPALIVRGAESDILTPDIVTRMRTVLNTAESAEIPGIGHAPSLNEPESLAAIEKFFGV
ncbi:MAG: alpha/beta fold hydrolase [Candidatus Binataceae bacterium]